MNPERILTEKQLDDLQWAKDFLNKYERKHKLRKNMSDIFRYV